ncbi:MAG: DNA repair protein RecN [Oscillospiraceae bacterium]|nr:DNA repair protein RecN [Oscillospiraceae bacterium]
MLYDLRINNIAIIKEADIHFDSGLNVLTGETGAGKSIIIDAINAILGERTSRELIRTGSNSADVSAFFCNINCEVKDLLSEMGITNEDDSSLLLYRKITQDGKNICRINGESVTVSMLKKIGQLLINVHGQMDNHNLLNQELHYTYIDSFAENVDLRNDYTECYENFLNTKRKLDSLVTDEGEKARKIDLLTFQINEIESASIRVGEKEELQKRQKVLQNAENLISLVNGTLEVLNGDDNFRGAGDLLSIASDNLIRASAFDDSLTETANIVAETSYNIADCASELSRFLYSLDVDPNELNEIEERLDLLFRLSKKYGSTEEEILEYLESAKSELDSITFSDKLKEQYERELFEKSAKLKESADLLSANRKKFSLDFINAVSDELKFLDMSSITFKTVHNIKEYDATGADEIYFLISANKGEEPKPLSKIASGGELSRIMLAIKNVLASKDNVGTLIFDEIDTGVSGRAAQKIGKKLKEVSLNRQVLCVTHLAQIASYADNHFLISKSESDNKTYTHIEPLDKDGRINELARIIGGIEPTKLSLSTAEEMIANAENNS